MDSARQICDNASTYSQTRPHIYTSLCEKALLSLQFVNARILMYHLNSIVLLLALAQQ